MADKDSGKGEEEEKAMFWGVKAEANIKRDDRGHKIWQGSVELGAGSW